MSAQRKRNIAAFSVIILLIGLAEIGRSTLVKYDPVNAGLLRSLIYIFLFSGWCVSISRRIIQKQAKRYLVSIASLMVFWIFIKSLKHTQDMSVDLQRMLWYLYYLPILFIALFSLLTAFHLGRSEDYKVPKWTYLLYIPTVVILLLVLTNDYHFLAFTFPHGINHFEVGEYGYGVIYYAVLIWCGICFTAAFIVVVLRSIVSSRKRKIWLPLIPVVVGIIYFATYYLNFGLIYRDFSTFTCLIIASVFESFFITRLIHTNSGYSELFKLSTVCARICDKNFQIRLTSRGALPLTDEQIRAAAKAPVMLDNNIRLDCEKIGYGYVFWQEDISSLIETINELDEINIELEDYYSVLREETAQKQEMLKVKEQNRLYTQTERDTAKSIKEASSILSEIMTTDDYDKAKKLLKKAIVISAYIKRRTNMIFILNQLNGITYREIQSCFDESIKALDSAGVDCAVVIAECEYTDAAKGFYDFFEAAIEKYFDNISSMLVSVDSDKITLTVSADCDEISFPDSFGASVVRDDDGLFYCTLKAGGEAYA